MVTDSLMSVVKTQPIIKQTGCENSGIIKRKFVLELFPSRVGSGSIAFDQEFTLRVLLPLSLTLIFVRIRVSN